MHRSGDVHIEDFRVWFARRIRIVGQRHGIFELAVGLWVTETGIGHDDVDSAMR